jgi:hypothetical protein
LARASPAEKLKRITQAISGWEREARRSTFSELSFAGFKAEMQPSLDAHARVKDLQQQLRIAITQRDHADARSLGIIYRVVCAVRGDQAYGRDSALCEAMGYTRENVRRIRIRRARKRKG